MPSNGRVGRPGVYTSWTSGNLNFLDKNGNIIFTVDGVHRALSLPSGSLLHASTGAAPVVSATKAAITTQNATPTAAQLLGGVIEHATTTGNGTFTLDTAAHLDAAIGGVANGDTFDCLVSNTGTFSSTVTTNTGLTLEGTVAIPAGKAAWLTFFRTGTAAWTVYVTVSA